MISVLHKFTKIINVTSTEARLALGSCSVEYKELYSVHAYTEFTELISLAQTPFAEF